MSKLSSLIQDFSKSNLIAFLRQNINTFKPKDEDFDYLFPDDIFEKYESIEKVGEATIENDDLIVLISKTTDPLTNRSGKKNQYEIAKKVLKNEVKDSAIFVFYDDDGNFRFSFVRANYLGTKRDFTDFKRYTYFVSPTQTNKTFIHQIGNCSFDSLDTIIEAFSVEPLNKQFYQEIQKSFYGLIGGKVKVGTRTQDFDTQLQLPSVDIGERKVYQEFGVRLIGRTIFCWFLKNKKSDTGLPLIPDSWLSSNTVNTTISEQHNYYHTFLEKLFFLVLNKKHENREPYNLPDGHEFIPFLNGGLFEVHTDDFFPADSKGIHQMMYNLKIPNKWFKELFETLEQFNFTIDENSINDAEVSIDPEMLGTIFENLLAEIDPDTEKSARKATGSFYTPREIVDYMVEQSLIQYLKIKTDIDNEEQLQLLFKEGGENEFNDDETESLLQALSTVKILDPACGSGAFPMGALHKITLSLKKLDPDAEWWKQQQLNKIPNTLVRKQLRNKLDEADNDYIRKLGVIQHSIFGVDIQPIATEISKLRSFLSLVIDETIDDTAENRGVEPLPNLEFKFVTANTLIGLPEEGGQQGLFDNYEELQLLEQLRSDYLQSSGKKKIKIKERFLRVRNKMSKGYNLFGDHESRSYKLMSWNPFNNEASTWFDPKWMYGVKKFDIVIGNPPYIQLQKAINSKLKLADLYKNQKFKTFERTGDIYALFYEKGINILSDKGLLCFITSNKWMRAKYGKSLRKFFSEINPLRLIDLGPGIFNSATVDTNILLVENYNSDKKELKALSLKDKYLINNLKEKDFTILTDLSEESWIILSPEEQAIKQKIERIGTPLKDWDINIYRGILTGYNEAFIIDGKTKDKLIEEDPKSAEIIKPLLRGRDIQRYEINFANLWLINTHNGYLDKQRSKISPIDIGKNPAIKSHLDQYWNKLAKRQDKGITPYNLRNCAYQDAFEQEKIVWAETIKIYFDGSRNFPRFSYLQAGYLDKTCFMLLTKKREEKYLLSILNSKIFEFYILKLVMTLGGGSLGLQKTYIEQIPIPRIAKAQQKQFEKLADKIIIKKNQEEDTVYEEQKIDLMVYKLYEFTYDEILIIDLDFNLTQQEYKNYSIDK